MLENLTNFSKLIRGAGQLMPRIKKMKEDLGKKEVEATSNSGHVSVYMSGSGIVTRIAVSPELLASNEHSHIEAQIIETMNVAIQRAKALHLKAVHEVVGDLGIPGIDRILEQLAE